MISIRTEQPGDAKAINHILETSYPTQMQAKLVNALRDNKHLTISLVALSDAKIIGYVAFSPIEVNFRNGNGVCLDPLAVLPAYRRKGVASKLVSAGLSACMGHGLGFIVVMGKPAYYKRFGFMRAAAYGLTNRYNDDDKFMAMELHQDMIYACGSVTYGREFV
jgi:putative acetyltransferase